jgi:hypothetical protein
MFYACLIVTVFFLGVWLLPPFNLILENGLMDAQLADLNPLFYLYESSYTLLVFLVIDLLSGNLVK